MNIDPSIAAWQAFTRAQASGEVGEELEAAVAAEERFSSGSGDERTEAYHELVAIGGRHPRAGAFGEFLVFITWSLLMDEPVREHFERGLSLCRDVIGRDAGDDPERLRRLRAMEHSFRGGLVEMAEDLMGYDADTLKSGD